MERREPVAREKARKSKHRPHRPAELGPRTFRRGRRWWWVDMRPFGGTRQPARDPKHPNWPGHGDRTMDAETAKRWAWAYLDLVRLDAKQRHLGLRGPGKPLGAEVARFLSHRELTASIKTVINNAAALEVHLVPALGSDRLVDTITPEHIQTWVNGMLAKEYAVGTIQSYTAIARTFFRWRSDNKHDPVHGVQLPDRGEQDVEPWTDAQIVELRRAADHLDTVVRPSGPASSVASYRLALELALATGCRVAELGALEWSAFDAEDRTVRVKAQIPPDGYGASLQPLKGRRNRTALVLPEWWQFHRDNATGRVLTGSETVSHRVMERLFSRILTTAKLKQPRKNAHAMRHTYARLCLERGARLEELQKFLGHASIRMTERYYGHLTDQSAATLARARIYGEMLRLVKPTPERRTG